MKKMKMKKLKKRMQKKKMKQSTTEQLEILKIFFGLEQEDYYKPVRVGNFQSNNYMEYENIKVRERRQLGFVTFSNNLGVSGWVGLAYDR